MTERENVGESEAGGAVSDAKGWDGICLKVGAKANAQLSRTFVLFKKHILVVVQVVQTHKTMAEKSEQRRRTEKAGVTQSK